MKPYVGAGLSPKKIRLALRESHNIPEERLPEPKQIANWKMYFHKCKQHDFLMGTNLELRDWAVQTRGCRPMMVSMLVEFLKTSQQKYYSDPSFVGQ